MIRTQASRTIAVESSLGPDALLLQRMSGSEQLGRLFHYDLDLVSEDAEIDPETVLGDVMTVRLEVGQEATRYFHGHVSRFTLVDVAGGLARYRAALVPWLWFLTRTADCRIFQEKTVPDIILEVFRDNGFSDFDDRLTGTYRTWEYCVQYRETDFNFVSRLMEQEGIYFYFEHSDGKHTLVLADGISAHNPFPEYETIKYYPPSRAAIRDEEHISNWSVEHEVQPTTYAQNDFDFKGPQKMLRTNHTLSRKHAQGAGEIYDYPGEYVEYGDGQTYAQARIEELQANFRTIRGAGNARGIACGSTFNFANFPCETYCKEYLVTSVSYQIEAPSYDAAGYGGGGQTFSSTFTAIESSQQFRPARVTPKPSIQGPQTAIVSGPAGEEVWVDKYGRVKVQFHWDRYGKTDEMSSCWVRVAQIWAGPKWGGMFIPRMGQEVVIEFLEGDPDHPLITGRVYNGDNMPPYDLPANKTQSGIKSRSSKGGTPSNFNEIRFEDKIGSEEFYMQAEKDHNLLVKNDRTDTVGHDETNSIGNDRTEDVGNDETITIGNDRTETVGNNETITIGNDRTETVGNNETITIGTDRTETVGSNETITIGSNRTETVGSNETITIGSNRTETVGSNETVTVALMRTHTVGVNDALTVGAAQEVTVGAAQAITVGAAQAVTVGANRALTVGGDQSESIGKNDTISVGKKLAITAGDEISITTGSASILMKKDGTITISGKDITINGSGKIDVKASKNITMKGQKILQN